MVDLETRARSAAAALLDAVDVPEVDAPVPRPHRRAPLVIAVVAVVAGAAFFASRSTHPTTPLSTGGSPSPPRLILDPPPSGLKVTGAAEVPAPRSGVESTWFGASEGANPFVGGDLWLLVETGDVSLPDGGSPVTVQGRPGVLSGGFNPAPTMFSWLPNDHTLLVLSTWTLPDAELEGVAECLVPGEKIVCQLPHGLREVYSSANAPESPFGAGGNVVGYQDEGPPVRSIEVSMTRGGADAMLPELWFYADTAKAVRVRGHDGWQGDRFGPSLMWRESDDVVVSMAGSGFTDAELLAAADSLRPATDAEWASLEKLTTQPGALPEGATLLAEGDTNGVGWRAYLDKDGSTCADLPDSSSCSGASGSATPIFGIVDPASLSDDPALGLRVGQASAEVFKVVPSFDDGSSQPPVTLVHTDRGDWYVVAFAGTAHLLHLTAYDAAGNVINTLDFGTQVPGG